MKSYLKKWMSILLVSALALSLSACGDEKKSEASNGTDTKTEPASEGGAVDTSNAEYTIRVGHTLQESTPSHEMFIEAFKPYVEEKSGGRIKVEIYPNSSLGGERQMVEACQIGTLEIAYVTTAVVANFDSKFKVFDLPFLFNDLSIARQAMDGELGDTVAADLEKSDLKFLCYAENGFRMVTNNKGPITTPENLKGIKIRTMENSIHMRAFELLGASPTPMAFTELYTALQQGTVDGEENPLFLIESSKFYEVQKYLSLTGHVYAPGISVMSLSFWNSLPEDLQQIVMEGIWEARDLQRELLDTQNEESLKALGEKMEVNELTPEQKEKFVEATSPVYEEVAKEIGQDLVDLAVKANETYQ